MSGQTLSQRLSPLLPLLPPLAAFAALLALDTLVPSLGRVIDLALPFFGLIGLGYGCGKLFDLPEEGLAWLNTFIVYCALPALFFVLISVTPFTELTNWRFVVCTSGATATAFAISFGIGMFSSRGDISVSAIQAVSGSYANIGYMGPGLTLAAFGAAAAAPTALIFVADTIFLFTALPLLMALGQKSGEHGWGRTLARAFWRIATHPFNISVAIAVTAAKFAWQPAAPIERILTLLSGAAAPCALFTLGVTVALRPIRRIAPELPALLFIKLIGQPLIAWTYLSLIGGFERVWVVTGVLMAALPPALNVFVMANQYGVYVERASSAILIGTLASVATVTALLWFVSTGLMPVSIFAY